MAFVPRNASCCVLLKHGDVRIVVHTAGHAMKRWTPWTVALAAVAAAVAVLLFRQYDWTERGAARYAERAVSAAIALLKDDPVAWREETRDAVRLGAAAAALGLISSAHADYVLAVQYQREYDVDTAESMYRRVMSTAPDWSWPYVSLGSLLGRNPDRLEEAEELLRTGIALEPDWGRSYNNLAIVLRQQGRFEEAEDQALFAIACAPGDFTVYNNYGNLLVFLGRYEEGADQFLGALELNPDHPQLSYNLACAYSLMGDSDMALYFLSEALARNPLLRLEAAKDTYLDAIRDTEAFSQLMEPEPDAPSETAESAASQAPDL